jgi:uncharacterized membrane protein
MMVLPAIFELGYFITRIFVVALVLAVVIAVLSLIRRPLIRASIRRELPAGATDAEVEVKVKSNQRSFFLKVWFFVFGIPMGIVVALLVANHMTLR